MTVGPFLASIAAAVLLAAISAGSMALEIVAGRMVAPYVGMSLYTWTAVIAVVLAGLSLGHGLGGVLCHAERRVSLARLSWMLIGAAVTALASLPLLRWLAPRLLDSGLQPVVAIVALTTALFLLPSLFVGTASPLLTKLALDAAPSAAGRRLGGMFAAGAAGSILGTLAAGYLFIPWVGTIGTVTVVAGGYAVAAIAVALAARCRAGLAVTAVLALATGTAALAAPQFLTNPCTRESAYYCLRVVDFSGEAAQPAAALVIDHLAHGINLRDHPATLYSSYVDLTDRLVAQKGLAPSGAGFAAFFVGGGALTLPRAWAVRYPAGRVIVAELDPAVTELAAERLWVTLGGPVTVIDGDARAVLARLPAGERFDAILGDAYHDLSVPAHLVTAEFARLVAGRLKPSGLFAQNVIDSARRPHFLYAMVKTLATVFPSVEVWVDPDQLAAGERTTFVVVSRLALPAVSARVLHSETTPGRRWLLWPAEHLAGKLGAAGVPVLTDDFAPVDRLMRAVFAEDVQP
ncbi:MAG: spermidine synthase [Azospirillum sp.]|nr:spermidine synthase [Azospirillum sp.]